MKIIKYIGIEIVLFAILFSLMFFLSDKTEYYTIDNYVQEPRVYVTDYGECYHAVDCHYLNRSRNEKGLYCALSEGYRACSFCDGIPNGMIEVNYYKTKSKNIANEVAIKSLTFASIHSAIHLVIYLIICIYKKNDKKNS